MNICIKDLSFLNSKSAEWFLEKTLTLPNLYVDLLEWGEGVCLWYTLNVLCMFRYSGIVSSLLQEKEKVGPPCLWSICSCSLHYAVKGYLGFSSDLDTSLLLSLLHFTTPLLNSSVSVKASSVSDARLFLTLTNWSWTKGSERESFWS